MLLDIKMENQEEESIKEKISSLIELGLIDNTVEGRINNLDQFKEMVSKWKKENRFDKLFTLFKALGNENRLLTLQLINSGVKCSCEIQYVLDLKQSTVSHHLAILKGANLINIDKTGKWNIIITEKDIMKKESIITLFDSIY